MINWTDIIYSFFIGASLLLSIMGVWFTVIVPGIEPWSRSFFRNHFLLLMATVLVSLFELLICYLHAAPVFLIIAWFFESFFLSLPLIMITVYLLHCCGENIRSSGLFHTVFFLEAFFLVMLIVSSFFDSFAAVTPDLEYIRGPLYPLFLLPMNLIMLVNLVGVIKRRKQLSRNTFRSFLIAIIPLTVSLIMHIFIDVFPLIDLCIVVFSLSMFGIVMSEQIEQDLNSQREIARQQQEIAAQRASIMVLQMRPHFIYNTMTSIYALCGQDPQLARKVVMDFTTYLRKNFTAVGSAEPIQFASELEHTRAYLAVEQAQYEDSIFVEYDTPHTFFRVPPLTLQPIVENAVKHGRDPYAGPFRISIRTRKTESGSEIVVTDNGRGYVPAEDTEPHIALNNIRQRLELMCGGSLTITPGDGGGTVVTVTIPDAAPADGDMREEKMKKKKNQ